MLTVPSKQRPGSRRIPPVALSGLPSHGFSLIEALVAVLILSIGILAVIKSLAAVTSLVAAGSVSTRVAMVASTKLESLLAVGCHGPGHSGDSVAGGIRIEWQLAAGHAIVVIDYPHRGHYRSYAVSASSWCSL